MATKKGGKKAAKKVKTLKLKRQTIKDVSGRDKKKIKGGGGAASGIVQSRVV